MLQLNKTKGRSGLQQNVLNLIHNTEFVLHPTLPQSFPARSCPYFDLQKMDATDNVFYSTTFSYSTLGLDIRDIPANLSFISLSC